MYYGFKFKIVIYKTYRKYIAENISSIARKIFLNGISTGSHLATLECNMQNQVDFVYWGKIYQNYVKI